MDIVPNPSTHYPHQKMMVVEMDDYLILVPFVEDQEKIFLKTAFKSRKITKKYRKSGGGSGNE